MKAAYIGLDVGTSGCKAAAVGVDGSIYASARREYGFECPVAGAVELNPDTVWKAVCETLSELGGMCSDMELRMLAVSSIGEAIVMLGKDDEILRNGITYLDQRGADTVPYISEKMGERYLHKLTGVPNNPMYTLNRYLWLKKHQPRITEKTEKCLMFGDYISYRLTGRRLIDPSSASRTMLFDAEHLVWSSEIGEVFGIPMETFSEIGETGTIIGEILPEIAAKTGLSDRLKVVLGCHDQCSALLGAGAVKPGDVMAGEGSTESINLIIGKEHFNDQFYERQLCFEPYIQKGQYLVPVGQLAHGTSIRWFVKEFWSELGTIAAQAGISIYDMAERECAGDSGELYFLPYLSRVNSMDAGNQALGAFLGVELGSDRKQMYRALLEGLCFESKISFELLKKADLPVGRIVASGGCSKSPLFMQMKADVLKATIEILKNPDAGIIGLAMICAVADGAYENYAEAAKVFVKKGETYMPQRDYENRYRKYCHISQTVKQLYKELNNECAHL